MNRDFRDRFGSRLTRTHIPGSEQDSFLDLAEKEYLADLPNPLANRAQYT